MRTTFHFACLLGLAGPLVGACLPGYSFEAPDGGAPSQDAADHPDGAGDATVDGGSPESSAGGDGALDSALEAGPSGCLGTKGSSMVRIDSTLPTASFCIDRYEVTNAEFNAYLLDPSATFQAPPMCAPEANGTLSKPQPASGGDSLPAVNMTFCDAWSYCLWAGKRLCASIGGPDAGHATSGSDLSNEWVYACQNGSIAFAYPYGTSYRSGACNVQDLEAGVDGVLAPPGTYASCHGLDGGFAQTFDMSGNVSEYDDYASAYDGDAGATIHARGGSFHFSYTQYSACSDSVAFSALNGNLDVGLRCCADVGP